MKTKTPSKTEMPPPVSRIHLLIQIQMEVQTGSFCWQLVEMDSDKKTVPCPLNGGT